MTPVPTEPGPPAFDFETTLMARHPDVQFREVGDEAFLVHPDGERIYNLNPMAAALWRLLAEPTRARDVADVVMAAFPVMAPERIESDVSAVLHDLLAAGFLEVRG